MGSRSGSARREDASLVALAVEGDRDAFAELIVRHRPMVVGLTQRLLADPHLAADATQEAIVVALVSLHRLRSPDRFGSWLCGIALNIARRWLRRNRSIDPLPGVDLSGVEPAADGRPPDELAEAALTACRVREVIDGLPAGQRQATLLFYLQGLSYRETATELDISVGAVKSRLHQARASLAPHFVDDRTPQEVQPMPDTAEPDTAEPNTAEPDTPEWIDVSIADVRAGGDDPAHRLHVVVLQDDTDRQLPIWIGRYEATSLAISLEAEEMPRPLTYEFTAGVLDAASARVVEVRLTELVAGVYYAVVVVEGPAGLRELDARPSDALNLAVVSDAPVRVAASVLDDPAAMNRQEWKDYADSASQLVREMRDHLERALAQGDDRRQRSHPIASRAPGS